MQQAARPWPGAAGPACPQPGARPRTQAWPTLGYILLLLACVREAAAAAGHLPRPGGRSFERRAPPASWLGTARALSPLPPLKQSPSKRSPSTPLVPHHAERGLRQAGLPWLEVRPHCWHPTNLPPSAAAARCGAVAGSGSARHGVHELLAACTPCRGLRSAALRVVLCAGPSARPRPGSPAPVPCPQVPWQPLLTQAEVQRGMYYGSGGRLRALATKLRAGQPVTVVLLGGSVTNAGELSRQGLSYAARFFSFLNSTFPNP